MEVDPQRKRISLTMRLDEAIAAAKNQGTEKPYKAEPNDKKAKNMAHNKGPAKAKPQKVANNAAMGDAFANAFAKLKK